MKQSILIASALFSTLILLISGCAGKPGPAEPVAIDKTLPQVSINGHLSDADAIAFEWKPVTDPRVLGVRIYRDNPGSKDEKIYRIATIDDTLRTHYVDNDLAPSTTYRYRFTTVDAQGRESMPDKTIKAKTLSLPEAVSYFTATKELARSAKLLWRPHPDLRVSGYEIERLDPGEKNFHWVNSVQGRLNAEYIDHDLEDNNVYRYRIVARTFNGKKTAPSSVVTVATKPLPLPAKALKASRGNIRTVNLNWQPSPNKDIAYYKVYRASSENGYYSYRAKVTNTFFTDNTEEDGVHYFYKVAAVDKDELESLPSEIAEGSTLPVPGAPKLTGVSLQGDAVVIRWKGTDPRTVGFELLKTTRSGWFDSKETVIRDIKTTSFTDANIAKGHEYSYRVIAVDANGLRSEPSESETIILEAQ
jgi:fibronectin type 3 domain-containing protein